MAEHLKIGEKRLYHVQSVSEYSDDPMGYFLIADHEPTKDEIRKVIADDFEEGDEWVETIVDNAETYSVYAVEVE